MLRSALTAVYAVASLPHAMTAVPKLKEFMQQRVHAKDDMNARYAAVKRQQEAQKAA
jgi:hypothetical protein